MPQLNLSKSILKVSILRADGSVDVICRKKRKKKKQSKELKPLEKMSRRMADANLASAKSYASSHRKSNGKKRDGWLRDLPKNMSKASEKAYDELT